MEEQKILYFDIETTGLTAMEDRVTCIGYANDLQSESIKVIQNIDEKKMLEEFWQLVPLDGVLCGFNSDSFDIPFLIKRSLIHGVRITRFSKTIDLRKIANSFQYSYNKYEKGTLAQWSVILLGIEKSTDGKEVIQAFHDKDWPTLIKHSEDDILMTQALYKRCVDCALI